MPCNFGGVKLEGRREIAQRGLMAKFQATASQANAKVRRLRNQRDTAVMASSSIMACLFCHEGRIWPIAEACDFLAVTRSYLPAGGASGTQRRGPARCRR
jgi:hypothetical protein